MNKWAIRLFYNEPIWMEDGREIMYNTEKEAEQALIEYLDECAKACEAGYMEDDGSDCDFRIVEVV